MGNNNSKEIQQLLIVNHPKFKTVKIKDDACMEVLMKLQNESDYYCWQNKINQIVNIQDDEYYLLPKAYEFENKKFCGQFSILKIEYWNYCYILEYQIQNRSLYGQYFQQEEIWYLMYGLVSARYFFSKLNKKVGDIRPLNIFLNSSGQIKIANTYSWPNQTTNFHKTLNDRNLTYLSPEQLQICRLGKLQTIFDIAAAQSFSIGLTLLHTCLLTSMQQLYQLNTFQFSQSILWQHLQNLMNLKFMSEKQNCQRLYSNQLKQIIIGLCQINQKKRMTSEKIYHQLCPYQSDIIKLKPFPIGQLFKRSHQMKIQNSRKTTQEPYFKPMIPAYQKKINFQKIINIPPKNPNTNNRNQSKKHLKSQFNSSVPKTPTYNQYSSSRMGLFKQSQIQYKYPELHTRMQNNDKKIQNIKNIRSNSSLVNSTTTNNDILKKMDKQLMRSRRLYN